MKVEVDVDRMTAVLLWWHSRAVSNDKLIRTLESRAAVVTHVRQPFRTGATSNTSLEF